MPLSPRRERAGLRASNRAALARVLATVTHEIRTPLGGIVGLADLLADTAATPEQMSYIEAIRTCGLALASLVDEVLDVSRIESGKFDLADERVDVATLVEGVVELLAPRAQGKGLDIASFVAPDVPAAIRGDAGRLRQVLLNLAGNAIKFTAAGGVGLRVERAGNSLRVRVEDTGPGVPPERQAAIFEPFEQGGAGGGTGLGLTISRRLVVRMGGTLDLEPAEAGATFCATLPLRAAGDAPVPRPDLAGRRVLVVGASRFGPAYLARTLRAGGALADEAATIEAALAALAASVPDTLLVDGAFGSAAAQALATQARAAGVRRSLILVSPYERRAFGALAVGGFDGWLVKPVRARSLTAQLAEAPRQDRRVEALRVLVADDDPVHALIATRHLQRLGALVTVVGDGAAATAAWAAGGRYDALLLDLRMPVHDGLAAARWIRAQEHASRRLPVRLLAMTAGTAPDAAAAARAAGFDEVLGKPLDLGQLGRVLERG